MILSARLKEKHESSLLQAPPRDCRVDSTFPKGTKHLTPGALCGAGSASLCPRPRRSTYDIHRPDSQDGVQQEYVGEVSLVPTNYVPVLRELMHSMIYRITKITPPLYRLLLKAAKEISE